jgi:predicted nucleotidyltransferase
MTQNEIVNKLKDIKPVLYDRISVQRIGYFGSYARNEQTRKSDIDILVEFSKPIGWEIRFNIFEYRLAKKGEGDWEKGRLG